LGSASGNGGEWRRDGVASGMFEVLAAAGLSVERASRLRGNYKGMTDIYFRILWSVERAPNIPPGWACMRALIGYDRCLRRSQRFS
ncbi:MAG: hypothetical protein KDB22_18830, partial [Planctomycetales bacterium]|nr:hypothetical protein [Planctomycetales bacterium]